jgi:hypothetical protein
MTVRGSTKRPGLPATRGAKDPTLRPQTRLKPAAVVGSREVGELARQIDTKVRNSPGMPFTRPPRTEVQGYADEVLPGLRTGTALIRPMASTLGSSHDVPPLLAIGDHRLSILTSVADGLSGIGPDSSPPNAAWFSRLRRLSAGSLAPRCADAANHRMSRFWVWV